MSETNYRDMSVAMLRSMAKEKGLGTGLQRAGASKATLVTALETGVWVAEAPAAPADAAAPSAETAVQLAALISQLAGGAVNEERVQRMIDARFDTLNLDPEPEDVMDILRDNVEWVREIARSVMPAPPTIRVQVGDRPEVEMPRQHERFPLLLAGLSCKLNVFLVGPAGTGKTTAAANAAKFLGVPFYATSVGPATTKGDLVGAPNADGTWRETAFLKAYRDGGIMLLDEMDRGSAASLTYLNMAVAGDVLPVGSAMVPKHPDFRLVACGNTYGSGASRVYVGASQLDGATLDRFFMVDWPLDEGLESHILGLPAPASTFRLDEGGITTTEFWAHRARSVRRAIESQGVRAIVGTRSLTAGEALLQAGVGVKWVEEGCLWRGMAADARARVEAAAK